MRLRQIAVASRALDACVANFNAVFGLSVAYNDPHIIHYGLRNAVIPAGRSFLEVVEPVREDASAGRFLSRWGRDAGYMLILQVADAAAETARAEALGVRVVDRLERPEYMASHFHPSDFGGVLVSFDQQRDEPDFRTDFGAWMPAGPDWRAHRTPFVTDLTAAVVTTADPAAMAARWSELLGRAPAGDDPLRIPLDMGEIRFAQGPPGERTAFAQVDLKVADPAAALARAQGAGVAANGGAMIGGVTFRPV